MASMFRLACASHVLVQLADRAFGAQRFSGGRTGRRYAPPSASGSASRCTPYSCLALGFEIEQLGFEVVGLLASF